MPSASDLATRIVQEQEAIIGPLAWNVAKGVTGLKVQNNRVVVSKSGSVVLAQLVKKYEHLFGPASREVCRDAVRPLLPRVPSEEVPDVLK